MASAKNSKSSAKTVTKASAKTAEKDSSTKDTSKITSKSASKATSKTTPKPAVKPAAKSKGLGKGILAIMISLTVMLIAVFVSMTIRKVKENRLNELTDYNDSPNVIMEVARYSVLLQETTYLTNQYNAIEGLNENLKTYPVCDSEIIDIVNDCADGYASVVIDSFDADLGVMAVTATADSVDNINKFIKNISAVDIFDNVDYTGYSFVESTGLWDIHVTFTLAESAGR